MKKDTEDYLQKRLLSVDELKKYYPQLNESDYTDLIYATFLHQKLNWGMFSEGWKGLLSSEYKTFHFGWFNIKTQFNPTRFVSSSAKVDEESIKKRRCFLCLENLPEEQKGTLFSSKSKSNEKLIFLCNPAPIFNEHFTVSHITHKPQEIFSNIGIILELAELCNNEYTIFYNGPRCGASAPDHFHFQACPAEELQTEKDFISNPDKFITLINESSFTIKFLKANEYLRNILILSSPDAKIIERLFNSFYKILQKVNGINFEPMMNLFALKRNADYHLIIFPREKHRPNCYFATDESNMLISPGLVDMCGMLITPLQKDFERINEEGIRQIYSEVTLSNEKFLQLLEEIKQTL